MTNPFERFRDTEVTIVEIKKDDYSGETQKKTLNSFMADVQPFSGGKAYEEYGAQVECQKRMFCDNHDNLSVKNYVMINDELYEIVYIADWNYGHSVLLRRVK